jgi:hypothetical protein
MAWTAPTDRTTGDVITAAQWNTFLGATGDMSMTAAAKVTTNGDMVYATAANTLARLGIGSTAQVLTVTGGVPVWASAASSTIKYKTTTQAISASTTLVDVITAGSPATMSFSVAANEVWTADYWIPLAFSGATGGVKFQITGPASPTSVDITGTRTSGDGGVGLTKGFQTPFTAVTAFSTDIASFVSGSYAVTQGYPNDAPCLVNIRLRLINGANAGTVTLQVAQNTASGTSTLGIGSIMQATKAA